MVQNPVTIAGLPRKCLILALFPGPISPIGSESQKGVNRVVGSGKYLNSKRTLVRREVSSMLPEAGTVACQLRDSVT